MATESEKPKVEDLGQEIQGKFSEVYQKGVKMLSEGDKESKKVANEMMGSVRVVSAYNAMDNPEQAKKFTDEAKAFYEKAGEVPHFIDDLYKKIEEKSKSYEKKKSK